MSAPLPRHPDLLDASRSALLVIDLQSRLLAAIPTAQRDVWNASRLVEGARALGVATAATEQRPDKLGPTVPELGERLPEPLAKACFSAGERGELVRGWLDEGRDQVLLCGAETHVCVAQTAMDLLAAGLSVAIAVDAVGSRYAVDHQTALRRLESCGATLTTTEAALFEWCATSEHAEFKTISALVKEPQPE
ncbi:putative isochorismatase [Pseudobythopirellula maris]|uniref:Putative isochorismatase n=1 Tax=Pseudobythopirellula maris TaxID=2527991 RepID=A0A5C5ZVB7_9BACT|nr:isochorismatase family protein [Pseudobythopirellula maris]TWT90163.1 putative isochorismatase [Pseudobythopirellula maris]